MPAPLLRDLAAQVEERHVYSRPADVAAYAYDAYGASGERRIPDAVVFPATTDEVAGVVEVCGHHGVPVVPRGAGTGCTGGAVADGGVVVVLTRLNRILGLDAEAMRVAAEAGVVTAAIQRHALADNVVYPIDLGAATTSTIGGNVACNAAGPFSLRYGATADYLVGATAVFGNGRITRLGEAGGGGNDILALLAGSEGTLAIVTEVILRLLPAPSARATLAAAYPDMARAVECVAEIAACGIVPTALECMDRGALDAVRAAGGHEIAGNPGAVVLVEVDGDEATVSADADALRGALTKSGATRVDHARDAVESAGLWAVRKSISAAVARVMIGKVNEDVVVPLSRIAELCDRITEIGQSHGTPTVTFGHLGEGNLHVTFLCDPRGRGERERADAAAAELFDTVLGFGGSLTGEHGIGTAKLSAVERQLGPETTALMRRIRSAVDPQSIMNPGKKIPAAGAGQPEQERDAELAGASAH